MTRTTPLADGWRFAQRGWGKEMLGTSSLDSLPAVIPGSVHLDLQRNGVIPDPHFRMNEIGVQWVDAVDWIYETEFNWTPDPTLPRRVLSFKGLDTIAEVFLNDELLARSDNMFLPLEVDVTDRLLTGENRLRIEFASAERVGQERQRAYFDENGITEPIVRFEPRSFVRKMQCAYGWDWGPVLRSCGIWQPIQLVEFAGRISKMTPRITWNDDGSAAVELEARIEGSGTLEGELTLLGFPDAPRAHAEEGVIHVMSPVLWQPLGWGEQARYRLTVRLVGDSRQTLDEVTRLIGFSRNRLLREKDEVGESFEFEINGRRLWVRGANWIPLKSFPGEITRAALRDRLLAATDLGCNMLRVWGGGLYESDDFYELCDELGILVWQDFPHACGYYPDDGEHAETIKREADFHIRRLRAHPSLALWCGNNENLQMWQQKWAGGDAVHPLRFYGERLYDAIYPEAVQSLDPEHSYIATSPCGESEPDCNGGKIGDSHYWDVWHGRGDWKHYADSNPRFSSEYGFASSCALATWTECLEEPDWAFDSPAVQWHDKTAKGYETFVGYTELHYPSPESLEDWTYYSQLNQRDAMRFGVEHFRRFVPCRGSLIWQLNDIWPGQSWALVDSGGRYKAAAYEVRRVYQDHALALVRRHVEMELWVINDGQTEWDGDLIIRAHHLSTGRVLRESREGFTASPDSRAKRLTFDLIGLNTAETIVLAHVAGEETTQTWRLLTEPKEARFAEPAPILTSGAHEGFVTLRLAAPVVDLLLTVGSEILPFRDNFVTVPEPGVVRVAVKGEVDLCQLEARSLAGDHVINITRSPL